MGAKKMKRIWVDSNFSHLLKMEAVKNKKSILDYTRDCAKKKKNDFKKPLLPLW